jgi:hypothetical protein
MVNFYVKMIKLGRITIDDVPILWREAVRAKLDDEG